MEVSLQSRAHGIIMGLVARRGWKLVEDAARFCGGVCAEVETRAGDEDKTWATRVERMAFRHYSRLLYAACTDEGPLHQRSAWQELRAYLYPIAVTQTRSRDQAEDSTQQAMVNIWAKLATVREPGKFLGFAKTTLLRECYDIRGRSSGPDQPAGPLPDPAGEDELERIASEERSALEQTLREESELETLSAIRRCIKSATQQLVILWSFYREFSSRQIAERLGATVNYVDVLRFRALRKLRHCPDYLQFVADALP